MTPTKPKLILTLSYRSPRPSIQLWAPDRELGALASVISLEAWLVGRVQEVTSLAKLRSLASKNSSEFAFCRSTCGLINEYESQIEFFEPYEWDLVNLPVIKQGPSYSYLVAILHKANLHMFSPE